MYTTAAAAAAAGALLILTRIKLVLFLYFLNGNQGQCLINVGGDVVQAVRCVEKDS
jgi:hypothetical protein